MGFEVNSQTHDPVVPFNGYTQPLNTELIERAIRTTRPWKNFRTSSILISNPARTSECVFFAAAALSNGAQAWLNGPQAGRFVHETSTFQVLGALAGKPKDGVDRSATYGAGMMGLHKVTKAEP